MFSSGLRMHAKDYAKPFRTPLDAALGIGTHQIYRKCSNGQSNIIGLERRCVAHVYTRHGAKWPIRQGRLLIKQALSWP